jgi:rod shape-determining protein MreC
MESVLGRYRNLIILVGVLFLQVLGLATQVKRGNDEEHTRLIRVWVVGAMSPLERGLVWAQNSAGNLWHNYFYLRGVRAENRQLKEHIEQMRLEQVRLTEDAAQARRLQTLLAFKEQFISRTVAAQVIGSSGSDMSRIVYIDKGENSGIRRDMAVITADGIVGKVLLAYPSVAQVLLINDQSSGVGAILEKTRLQGVLRGTGGGEVVLERVMSDEQVPLGETVLTSGGDQIFPKGLPVGTVSGVGNGKDLFLNIKIRPAANLSKLEEVLVLVEKQERPTVAEDGVRVRAADILAQRLPSVPDKPAAGSNTPAGVSEGKSGANSAAASNGAKSQPLPKIEVAPSSGVGSKPQGTAGSANPLGASIAPKPASAAPKAVRPAATDTSAAPSGTAADQTSPEQNQPQKSTSTASGRPTGPEPQASDTNQTKPAKPSTPQPNSQPPADESSPH